jgi:pyrroline-5-carboxylate reductase
MADELKVAFVGAGVMAEAMIKGLLNQRLIEPGCITAADVRKERGEELKGKYAIQFTADNRSALDGADVAILAVKPQVLPDVLPNLNGHIPGKALVISIVAGARVSVIVEGLAHKIVVRAMPNTPAQIGQGMTVWTAAPAVEETRRAQARQILGALGAEAFVSDEDLLDAATALSGSGPAYVFLFMEALVDAGVHLGFSRPLSEQLVLQTVKGSVEYAKAASQPLATLRNQVTSPGGTTAEAMYFLEKEGFRSAVSRAVWAAFQRSVQLGKGMKRSELTKE